MVPPLDNKYYILSEQGVTNLVYHYILKATEQSDTGLNTKFVNVESGRTVTLKHAIKQIENGNKNYSDYQTVRNSNGTVYIRSKADGKRSNNIE